MNGNFYTTRGFRVGLVLALLVVGCVAGVHEVSEPLTLTSRVAVSAEAARVVRVLDADMYIVLARPTTYRLRLLGVDAPETGQPFGAQAADSVRKLLSGRVLLVSKAGLDLYRRTLCAVLLPPAPLGPSGRAVALDSLLVGRGWARVGAGVREWAAVSAAYWPAAGRAAGAARAVEMRNQ